MLWLHLACASTVTKRHVCLFFCFGSEGFACFSIHTFKTTLLPVLLAGKPLWASLWSLITVRSDWWRIYRAVTLRVCKWILGLLRGRACQPSLAGAGAGTPASTRSRQTISDKPANESENQNQEEAQGAKSLSGRINGEHFRSWMMIHNKKSLDVTWQVIRRMVVLQGQEALAQGCLPAKGRSPRWPWTSVIYTPTAPLTTRLGKRLSALLKQYKSFAPIQISLVLTCFY